MSVRINQVQKFMVEQVTIARDAIYRLANGICSKPVEDLLKHFSGPKFNPSQMLVIDLLHEFELGVWKALFTHLIHLLHAAGRGSDDLVVQLDRRYRDISTFGHGTICKFAVNSSEIKKLAARDFEDLLQCALPAFEGLLAEPHNK
ncbi:hypothetical protein BDZ97DRAFT_1765812 [Flammula alnicola]|nr:hypothetical protein BDZ97DRAFT_1765812 [Flammula alnicola]